MSEVVIHVHGDTDAAAAVMQQLAKQAGVL